MTIIPIIPFEEMSPEDQRAHLEELLAEDGFEQIDNFFKVRRRSRKDERMNKGSYVTARWAAGKVGKGEDSIRNEFMKESAPCVKKETHSGRNRKTVHTLLISKSCLKQHYPNVEL